MAYFHKEKEDYLLSIQTPSNIVNLAYEIINLHDKKDDLRVLALYYKNRCEDLEKREEEFRKLSEQCRRKS